MSGRSAELGCSLDAGIPWRALRAQLTSAGLVCGCGTTSAGRAIVYLMIAGNAVGFGLYLPAIGVALSAGSGIVLWAWYILLARRFLPLGQGITPQGTLT